MGAVVSDKGRQAGRQAGQGKRWVGGALRVLVGSVHQLFEAMLVNGSSWLWWGLIQARRETGGELDHESSQGDQDSKWVREGGWVKR